MATDPSPSGDRPEFPFPRTTEVRLEFEVLERLKRRARREHRRTPAECIEIASQLSELFPASNRVVQRFEFDEGEGRRML